MSIRKKKFLLLKENRLILAKRGGKRGMVYSSKRTTEWVWQKMAEETFSVDQSASLEAE